MKILPGKFILLRNQYQSDLFLGLEKVEEEAWTAERETKALRAVQQLARIASTKWTYRAMHTVR